MKILKNECFIDNEELHDWLRKVYNAGYGKGFDYGYNIGYNKGREDLASRLY